MSKKRLLASLFLPLLLASFLQSQSLVELAKKEKERRAALKGKGTTVTTADIAKVKKRPAVESTQEQAATEGEAQAGEAEAKAQQEGTPPVAGQQAAEAAGGAESEKAAEETPPADKAALSAQEIQKKQNELADIAQQKIEMVDLLTLKLNALYQEFYGLDNLKSREMIQVQISDTYDKLLKAETESAKAKKDLEDFLAESKKASAPQIWIK
jgi:hypothetical protein